MILDQFGREIRSNKPILEEIAVQTVRDRYGSYPSQGLTPDRLARIFKQADQGDITRQAELFEEMEEKDLHLGGVLQTRRLAVAGLEWEILPASDAAEDKKIAEAAREMIAYVEDWEEALLDALDAIGKGFSAQEIMWEISEGACWVKTCEWVHQKRFTFNSPEAILKAPKLITDAAPVWGEDLPPNKFLVHASKARSGITPRGGLCRPCAWMYLFKNYDIKDWLVFNELFSVPMRVGKYKAGSTPKEIDVLKQAVYNLGTDAAAVISDSTVIELLELKMRGDVGAFEKLAEFCDKAISKGVLGHTGSAEGTPGKLGSEDQARDVRQDLLEADAKSLEKTIKFQLLKAWAAFNFGPQAGVPTFKLHYEVGEDLEKTARTYGVLVKEVNFSGIPEDHIYERFAIPKPTGTQRTIQPPAPASPFGLPPMADKPKANKAPFLLVKNTGTPGDSANWLETYIQRLGPALSTARAGALDAIEAWLRTLPGPPTETEFVSRAQEILGASYATLDTKAITDTVSDMYLSWRGAPGAQVAFGGPDIRAVNFLSTVDRFYVSSYIRNPDAAKTVADFLSQRYLEQGAGLFGRGAPEDVKSFRDLFSQKLVDLEDWQIRRIVDTSVQRTRNWAATAQMNDARISEMVIYEPTKECEFCAAMNGRTVSVATAYNRMTEQMGMTPGEYEQDMRSASPVEANAGALVTEGRLPPYHPHCHGMVLTRTS